MMKDEEMVGLDNDSAHRGQTSVTMNPDGDGLMLSKRCVIIGGTISGAVIIGLIISVIFNTVQGAMLRQYQVDLGPLDFVSCSQDWVKEGRMAYFFSKVEEDWYSSQKYCSSCSGSLVAIEDTQEMEFIMKNRDPAEYWLGLQRGRVQQPWKTMNGSVFNNWFPIQGEGLCAYLNEQVVLHQASSHELLQRTLQVHLLLQENFLTFHPQDRPPLHPLSSSAIHLDPYACLCPVEKNSKACLRTQEQFNFSQQDHPPSSLTCSLEERAHHELCRQCIKLYYLQINQLPWNSTFPP